MQLFEQKLGEGLLEGELDFDVFLVVSGPGITLKPDAGEGGVFAEDSVIV